MTVLTWYEDQQFSERDTNEVKFETIGQSLSEVQDRALSSPMDAHTHAALRSAYRRGLGWWARTRLARQLEHVHVQRVDGVSLVMLPGVFDGVLLRSGAFLARALTDISLNAHTRVLDLGTGSGIGAIFAARRGAQVIASDINPEAARCARINALVHQLDTQIDVRVGDLFAPVNGERFDLVLFNPPYYRAQPRDMADRAWRSVDTFDRFVRELPDHLAAHGRALVVLSSDCEIADALHAADHLAVRVLQQRDLINEILTVYEIRDA